MRNRKVGHPFTVNLQICVIFKYVCLLNELNIWLNYRRNDFISHVREAAQVALEQIGGTEANKAMHMTKVLAEEIRMLTQE